MFDRYVAVLAFAGLVSLSGTCANADASGVIAVAETSAAGAAQRSNSPAEASNAPVAEPVVHAVRHAPAVYEEDVAAGGLFLLGEFVFRNGGDDSVVKYQYGFGSTMDYFADAADGRRGRSDRVEFRPEHAGVTTLQVRGVDSSGQVGPTRRYVIVVDGPAERGRWSFTEGAGTVAADQSGKGHDLSLTRSTTWIRGLVDFALHFDEPMDAVMSNAPIVGTRHRFTVSALVRLDSLASSGVAVSQDGDNRSGYSLGYVADCTDASGVIPAGGCFAIWAPDSDSAGDPPAAVAASPERVVAGDWYVLVGVYNDAAPTGEQLRIYSCNTLGFEPETGATGRPSGWRADGPLRLGQGDIGGAVVDPWQGDVDSVTVYHGAMDEAGVNRKCAGG